MTRIKLSPGQRFEYSNKVWEIKERLLDGRILVQDLSYGEKRYFTDNEIANSLASDNLRFEIWGKNVKKSERLNTQYKYQDLSEINEVYRKIAVERFFIIKPLVNIHRTKSDVEKRVSEVRNNPEINDKFQVYKDNLSLSNVYRWISCYEKSGCDIRSLVPSYDESGGKGKSRLSDEVDKIIADVLSSRFLFGERPTMQSMHYEIMYAIQQNNKLRDDNNHLPIPCYSTIRNKIKLLHPYFLNKERYGARIANLEYKETYAGAERNIIRPLELVYIDHTTIDLFLVDEEDRLPIGRPTFTFAIDVATRYPLGFYIGFDPPSYRTVMECLYHSILPKTYVPEMFPQIKESWEAWGVPEEAMVDNGKEFLSNSFQDACYQLGINLCYARPKVPEDKDIIERSFGTINTMLLHEIPGTSFSNIFDRKDYDPKKNAIISIQAFEEIVHIFLLNLATKPRKALGGISPKEAWERGCKEFPPSLPHSRNELVPLLGAVEYRLLTKSGIQFYEIFYNSPEIARIRSYINNKKEKVKIKYLANDLSYIYVWDEKHQSYVKVYATNQEYTKGLSLWKHKKILKYTKEVMKEANMENFLCTRKIIEEIIDKEWIKTKKTQTRKMLGRAKGIEGAVYDVIRGGDNEKLLNKTPRNPEVVKSSNIQIENIAIYGAKQKNTSLVYKKIKPTAGRSKKKPSEDVLLEKIDTSPDLNGWS